MNGSWGAKYVDSTIHLKPGTKNYFKALVMKDYVFLRQKTVLGILECISSVAPIQVKHRTFNNTKSVWGEHNKPEWSRRNNPMHHFARTWRGCW